MSEIQVATLNVAFEGGDDGIGEGNNRIVLQQTSTRLDFFGHLYARVNSRLPCRYTASVGQVNPLATTWTESVNEGLKFSNSGRANLKYPSVREVVIDTTRSLLMKKIIRYGRQQIVPATDVSVVYNEELNVVQVGRSEGSLAGGDLKFVEVPVWGAVAITYEAYFIPLQYVPGFRRFPRGGTEFSIGSIFAYHDYAVEVLDMKVVGSSSKDWNEYCRVYSKIVLDPKGVWEFPPNWEQTYQSNRDKQGEQRANMPGEGRWPDHNAASVDPDNHFVDERVHLIIEVNSFGQLKTTAFHHSNEQPKIGFFGYDPTYHLRFTDPPGGAKASSAEEFKYDLRNRTWRDVFLDVDKDRITSELKKLFTELKVENPRSPSP
jgi:hypothetical protein